MCALSAAIGALDAQTGVTTGAGGVPRRVADALLDLAAAQYGLLTHAQASAAGLGSRAVQHRVRRGDWERLRRGVYRVAGVPWSWEQDVLGAVLACGGHAWASHGTAMRLWGYAGFETDTIEVTVPLERVVRLDGIRAHRSGTVTDADVRRVGAIPTLSVARTIVDLSNRCTDVRLGELVDEGLRRRILSIASLHAVARRLPTIAPGRSPQRVTRILAVRTGGYEPGDSELESRVLRAITAAGLPEPVRQHRVVVGERTYYLDLAYPDRKVAIEVDGFDYHRDRGAFDGDRRRQNDLVGAGWTVLRFTSTSSDDEIAAAVRLCVE